MAVLNLKYTRLRGKSQYLSNAFAIMLNVSDLEVSFKFKVEGRWDIEYCPVFYLGQSVSEWLYLDIYK